MAASSTARAYQEAAARLRRRHDDEFHAILKEVYAEWGLKVEKRRSRRQAALHRFEEAKRVLDSP
jgi:glutathione synthase/RimK-type ligase-like ATP-grasp enzyme